MSSVVIDLKCVKAICLRTYDSACINVIVMPPLQFRNIDEVTEIFHYIILKNNIGT